MEFDCIIFGADSAGCVFTDRRTSAEGNKDLFLKAGLKNTVDLSIWPIFDTIL